MQKGLHIEATKELCRMYVYGKYVVRGAVLQCLHDMRRGREEPADDPVAVDDRDFDHQVHENVHVKVGHLAQVLRVPVVEVLSALKQYDADNRLMLQTGDKAVRGINALSPTLRKAAAYSSPRRRATTKNDSIAIPFSFLSLPLRSIRNKSSPCACTQAS
jgi:hypothetical protein